MAESSVDPAEQLSRAQAERARLGPLLAVAVLGHVGAFVAWFDEIGHLAGSFAVPVGVIATIQFGMRGAYGATAWALFVNALLGALLPGAHGERTGLLHTVLDAHYLLGHCVLALAVTILGRQRELKLELERRMAELARTQAALREAERVREEARLSQRLSRADRMASVGTLAAGVAHEINNPLTYVIGNLFYALEELGREGRNEEELKKELGELLRDALDGAQRVRRIVRDLKTFSRATDDEPEQRIDVRASIETAVNLMRNEIRHRAQLVLALEDLPSVAGNESRLVQALVNLLMNGAQAIPEGNAEQETLEVRACVEQERVRIDVRDTGLGMSKEVAAHIFDPFFTTKPVGVGTGLGLSVTQSIIEAMGGTLSVESEEGKGSTFTITLPVDTSSSSMPAARSSLLPARPRLRVLVIDDEPKVGISLRRMLREWDVVVLEDGREALRLLKRDREFDAVLCDLMMPHLTGMELYGEVQALDPELARRFVFMTGGAFTPRARAFISDVPNLTLEKPFEKGQVRAAVESVLRGSSGRGPREPALAERINLR